MRQDGRGRAGGVAIPLTLLLAVLVCWGCLPKDGRVVAQGLADGQGWRRQAFRAAPFGLVGWLKPGEGEVLTVYLEGDGRAFLDRRTVSGDPTPADPLALRLALADPAPLVLYLGRPCQYVDLVREPACAPAVWTDRRFSPEVLASLGQALDQAKTLTGATALRLAGYSGGGGLAALLAASRNDVVGLLTVAGNLDHAAWTAHHGVSPLAGSLNALDAASGLADIPQLHFMGQADDVVPPAVNQAFLARLSATGAASDAAPVIVLPGYDHRRPWATTWPELLRRYGHLAGFCPAGDQKP